MALQAIVHFRKTKLPESGTSLIDDMREKTTRGKLCISLCVISVLLF